MTVSLRSVVLFLVVGVLLLLALVFQKFVLANIVLPAATVAWLLLRIFVLSLDQQTYWWGLIILAGLAGLVRLFQITMANAPGPLPSPGTVRDRASYWRESILANARETSNEDAFRRELSWLIATLCSSQMRGSAKYQVREALLQRQIPLPESVHAFLFSSDASAPQQPGGALFSARRAFRGRIRRRTGRAVFEYFRSIDEVLTFMEASMEMKNDDTTTGITDM
ncbi:MAG: hypothetical protein ABSG38_09580 [Spirochaetia bacterium]|jgi:hypothetical protein